MQSGNSAATSSGPSGAASAAAPRKSIRGCWRKGSEIEFIRHARLDRASTFTMEKKGNFITMGKIEINGNYNQVNNRVKRSRINSDDVNGEPKLHWTTWVIIVVSVLALIATCIIGREQIVSFFG